MANSLFRTIKDAAGNLIGFNGLSAGEAIGAKVAALVTAFQDSSGNAVFPTLTPLGAIPVDEPGFCLQSVGPNPTLAGTATFADITAAAITLTDDKEHSKLKGFVAAAQESLFVIYQQDDATKTELFTLHVGPGNTTISIDLGCFGVTAGNTGTQELRIEAKNCDANQLTPMYAFLTINQAP